MFELQFNQAEKKATLIGDMTIYSAMEAKHQLSAIAQEPGLLVLDLSALSELDSAGAQLLMALKKQRSLNNLDTTFASHSDAVLETFELLGLVSYFGDPVVIEKSRSSNL